MKKYYELPKHLILRAMRAADEDIRKKHLAGVFDDGDPNHPKHNNGINYATGKPATLFGYPTDEFLARQYPRETT